MDALPGAVIAPAAKVAVDALPLGILFGQEPPLDAADGQIQDGIDDLPHRQVARSSTWFGEWDQRLDNTPLAVGEIGGVQLCVHSHNLYSPSPPATTF